MRRIVPCSKALCLLALFWHIMCFSYQAVTSVPVADLVGSSLPHTHDYTTLPVCGGKPKAFASCKRLHQLLFNEIVEVNQELNGQVEVTLPHLFFVPPTDKNHKMATYWTLKKNILPLNDTLKTLVPKALSYENPQPPQTNIITLIAPYTAPTFNCTFSAGTRFIVSETNPELKTVTVLLFHPTQHTPTTLTLPTHYCLKTSTEREQQRKNFVKLAQLWARTHAIPYVWGGCSYVFKGPEDSFKEIETGTNQSHYTLVPEAGTPKTGFDCAGLIARAAQAAGLPYFFKNTTTLATYLQELTATEKLQDGDLLWIPGHVMILSNRDHNLLLEARDYSSGWGRIHERPLHEIFKGITTYSDLEACYRSKKPLQRINKQGTITGTYSGFKLLALSSIWQNN